METIVVLSFIAIGFKIGKTMSDPDNYQQRTVPEKKHKKHKKDKKYIVYPNFIVDDINILNDLDAMEKGFEIRSSIRV